VQLQKNIFNLPWHWQVEHPSGQVTWTTFVKAETAVRVQMISNLDNTFFNGAPARVMLS